jgi:transposase
MLIRKAFRYRLYPIADQEQIFAQNFGQTRFLYNFFLAERKAFYEAHKTEKKKGLTYKDNANALKKLKENPQYAWLKIGHSQVLQQSLIDLDKAYQNYFSKRARFPKFHKKNDKQSARYMQYVFVGENWIDFPKIGKVNAVIHRPCEGKMKNVTVTKTKSGRYFASVQVEVIDRFYPSSRECSNCHYVLPELKLSVREWDCPVCGTHHDRDHNAAKNIENEAKTRAGIAQSYADGEDVRPALKSWQPSRKSEEAARSLA